MAPPMAPLSYLRLLSPIYIDQESLFDAKPTLSDEEWSSWCVETLTHILAVHPGPIRYCCFIDPFWVHERQTLTRLLQTLTQKGVQQLELSLDDTPFNLPRCILECESLLNLSLCCTTFPEHLPERIFPNLRGLRMWLDDLVTHTLSELLSRSSIIDLGIVCSSGPKQVIVESNSLKRLKVWYNANKALEKLVIKNAPNLECFILTGTPTEYFELTILNAPKLRVLVCINMNFSSLQLGESRFDRTINPINFSSFSTRMHSLTKLTIKVCFSSVNQGKSIPYLLRCFPCLELLNVLIDDMRTDDTNSSPSYGDYWEQHFGIDCLDHHLKYVLLEGYSGEQSHVDFANFIISKARVLKTMTLVCGSKWEEQWVEDQKERLLLGNRASQVAQVVFCKTRRCMKFGQKM